MKFTSGFALLHTIASWQVCAAHHPGEWAPPGHGDFRGPCPMMNTLANHGFIPRDGRNITKHNAITGLGAGLNFDADLASLMWDQAIIANPEPNSTFFTLDHLNRHNVLEHDASLSRTDAYFGSNHIFNQTIFDSTKTWWTEETLTPLMLANSKLGRQLESRRDNPEYRFTASTEEFSLGEVAAPVIAFGSLDSGEVRRELVTYFFENERLPTELGWHKKNATVTLTDILNTVTLIREATNLLTPGDASHASEKKRIDGGYEGGQFHL